MTIFSTILSSSSSSSGGKSFGYTWSTAGSSPSASTTYFIITGAAITSFTAHGPAATRFYIPISGTITSAVGVFTCTAGSNENTTLALRLNNTTNTNISTTLQFNAAEVAVSNTALSISVSAGDYVELLLITPAWGTPPTNVRLTTTVWGFQ